MAWNKNDEMVGQQVTIYYDDDDSDSAMVVAVSDRTDKIWVQTAGGETWVGNTWD